MGSLAEAAMPETETETSSDSDSEPREDGTVISETQPATGINLQAMYNAAMMLRHEIDQQDTFEVPWPPTSSDLSVENAERIVPIAIYNVFAWMLGLSDEPTLDRLVHIDSSSHLKLLSIIQDML